MANVVRFLQTSGIAAFGTARTTSLQVTSLTNMAHMLMSLAGLVRNDMLLAAHQVFTGKNLSCVEEGSGQAVISYKTSMLPANQVGSMTVSAKVPPLHCWISCNISSHLDPHVLLFHTAGSHTSMGLMSTCSSLAQQLAFWPASAYSSTANLLPLLCSCKATISRSFWERSSPSRSGTADAGETADVQFGVSYMIMRLGRILILLCAQPAGVWRQTLQP